MKKIRNVLRALKQKWASEKVKRDMWDGEYESGNWEHCEATPDAEVYKYVEEYAQNGSILDLGCGAGNTGNEIAIDKYRDYEGIDISRVALKKASKRSAACGRDGKNTYVQGSIELYKPSKKYDVILFRESIYYIPYVRIKPTLDRYRTYLSERGVFVVNASKSTSKQSVKISSLLEENYFIVAKYATPGLDAHILVFR